MSRSESGRRIDISPQAQAHPLFPALDYIIRNVYSNQKKLESIDARLSRVENVCSQIQETQKELNQLIKEFGVDSFNIEKTHYQAPLRKGIAGLFCTSLLRNPTEESILRMVSRVLREEVRIKHKLNAAVKYVTSFVATFRRRRVIFPTVKYKNKNTKDLARLIMDYLKASDDNFDKYYQNLVVLRKYVRETPDIKEQKFMWHHFKAWLQEEYHITSDSDSFPREQLQQLIQEDETYNYEHSSIEEPLPNNDVSEAPESDGSDEQDSADVNDIDDFYNFV